MSEFCYDYAGRRIRKDSQFVQIGEDDFPSDTRLYIYDQQSCLAEYNITDTLDLDKTRQYIYGNELLAMEKLGSGSKSSPDPDSPIHRLTHSPQKSDSPTTVFYHQDALGSTVNITTTDGTVEKAYIYDAWGNFRELDIGGQSNTAPDLDENGFYAWEYYLEEVQAAFADDENRFTYTGHEFDPSTGLYYFKARFYDPELGRFNSQDPYLGDSLTPPSLHRYFYAFVNPLRYIDLTGYNNEDQFEWVQRRFNQPGLGKGFEIDDFMGRVPKVAPRVFSKENLRIILKRYEATYDLIIEDTDKFVENLLTGSITTDQIADLLESKFEYGGKVFLKWSGYTDEEKDEAVKEILTKSVEVSITLTLYRVLKTRDLKFHKESNVGKKRRVFLIENLRNVFKKHKTGKDRGQTKIVSAQEHLKNINTPGTPGHKTISWKENLSSPNPVDYDTFSRQYARKYNEAKKRLAKSEIKALDYTPGDRRYIPGIASHGGSLPEITNGKRWLKGSHGNAAKIPAHLAEKLAGRQFKTFDDLREAFWREVGNDSILSAGFNTGNVRLMKSGRPPAAVSTQQVGKRIKYELDHLQGIQDGGNVYDMNNIIIRTPLNHIKGK